MQDSINNPLLEPPKNGEQYQKISGAVVNLDAPSDARVISRNVNGNIETFYRVG